MGFKTYMGKNEERAIAIICLLIALTGAILITSTMKPFGTAYEQVDVIYSEAGENIVIKEEYTTRVGMNSFNVLYRSFAETICLSTTGSESGTNSNCNFIIQEVSCSKGTPYFSTYYGSPINMLTGESFKPRLSSKIKSQEVGCYSDNEFNNEQNTLTIRYQVPLTHVQKNRNTHYLFSQDHFAINQLNIQGLQASQTKNYLPKDTAVTINVLSGEITVKGIAYSIQILVWALLALIPFIIWNIYGREKKFVVPTYMHVLPNKKTSPWEVDVLTNGKNEMSKNGMAGILMELYVAGIVTVDVVRKTFTKTYEFKVDNEKETTGISEKAITFKQKLLQYTERREGKFSICVLPNKSPAFSTWMQGFFKTGDVASFIKQTFDKKGSHVMIGYFIMVIIAFFSLGYVKNSQSIYFFIIFFFVLTGVLPKSLFSRFKEEKYKEYLEWHAFNNMLQDYAKIQQYLKADKHMWKEWLTYAAALGSADKLLKSMKELNILSPTEYERTNTMYTHFIAYSIISNQTAHPRSSGSGGGIGGGGGFGGGGGGGR